MQHTMKWSEQSNCSPMNNEHDMQVDFRGSKLKAAFILYDKTEIMAKEVRNIPRKNESTRARSIRFFFSLVGSFIDLNCMS